MKNNGNFGLVYREGESDKKWKRIEPNGEIISNQVNHMKKIVVATNNEGKLKEIKEILNDYEFVSLKDMNCNIEIVEDKNTFEENSKKKAQEISEKLHMPCIADDSGLCIDIYHGWPGVHTARFLGKGATPEQRNGYILEKMKTLEGEKRKASVVCCITYYENGKCIIGKGVIEGKIAKEIRGNNGFGFDSIFELEDGRTYAELSTEEKNKISHRKLALQDLMKKMIGENTDGRS